MAYHVSTRQLASDQELRFNSDSSPTDARAQVDQVLDKLRPSNAPARSQSLYAFVTLARAIRYRDSERKHAHFGLEPARVYEVVVGKGAWEASMAVAGLVVNCTDRIQQQIRQFR